MLILGIIKESGAKHKGLIEIPNLSEENEVDDTEVRYLMEFLSILADSQPLHHQGSPILFFFLNQVSVRRVEHLKNC